MIDSYTLLRLLGLIGATEDTTTPPVTPEPPPVIPEAKPKKRRRGSLQRKFWNDPPHTEEIRLNHKLILSSSDEYVIKNKISIRSESENRVFRNILDYIEMDSIV